MQWSKTSTPQISNIVFLRSFSPKGALIDKNVLLISISLILMVFYLFENACHAIVIISIIEDQFFSHFYTM